MSPVKKVNKQCQVCKIHKRGKRWSGGTCRDCFIKASPVSEEEEGILFRTLEERNAVSKELCCSRCEHPMFHKKLLIDPDTGKFLCNKCNSYQRRLITRKRAVFTCGDCKKTMRGRIHNVPGTKTAICHSCSTHYKRTGEARELRKKETAPKQKREEPAQSSSKSLEHITCTEPKKPIKSFRIDDILGLSPTSSEAVSYDYSAPVWTQVDEEIQLLENPAPSTDFSQIFLPNSKPMEIPSGIRHAKIQKQQELEPSAFNHVCCNPLCKAEITGRRGRHPEFFESLCIPCSDYLLENNQWRKPEEIKDNTSPRISPVCYRLRCVKPLSQRNYVNLTFGKYVCWDCHKRWY